MKTLLAVGMVSAGLLVAPLNVPADAVSAHPPVKAQSCRTVAAQVGARNMWGTSFYGEREDVFDVRWPYRNAPCFKNQQSCKAWLYWAQTYYWEMMQFQPCRKGGY